MAIERGSSFLSPVVAVLVLTLASACVTVAPGAPSAPTQGPSSTAATTPAPEPTGTVQATLTPSPGINLIITNFEFVPDTVKAGELTELRLSVKNIGSVTSPPFNVGFGFTTASGGGGGFKAMHDPDGLLPGQQTNYSIPRRLLDVDVYAMTAEADNDHQIDEDDEDDNEASATLTVTPPPPGPNLIVSSFTITPESICAGDSAVFAYSVTNTGTEPATEFFLQLFWETAEGLTGSYSGPYVDVLDPAGTFSRSDSHQVDSAGSYTFRAVVDPDGNVSESSETDNEAEVDLSVC